MVAFLQFYAFIFACCFAWQVGRPSLSWSQKITRAFLTSINGLFVFFRASVSIFLLVGPLVLVSYYVFPNLLRFEGGLSIVISVLVIGLIDRLVSLIILPLVRSFFLKRKRIMPQLLEACLYTVSMTVLLYINLTAVPGVQMSLAIPIFFGFTIYFAHYLVALIRLRQIKKKLAVGSNKEQ
ncbi:hypothetical protein [Exiguobacterium sp. s193]|uniref:hypothetical protein n=1 Tax=Exiguobacterium sp. s193 TaxID=2751207 RepID=UPI001BE5D320|nr:hypothetical protein [Exiguobacterium sp. s193]